MPLMAGLIAALLAAIASAVAADLKAGRIVEVWQVEQQLSLPVLGQVPKVSSAPPAAKEVTEPAAAPHAVTSRRGFRSSAP